MKKIWSIMLTFVLVAALLIGCTGTPASNAPAGSGDGASSGDLSTAYDGDSVVMSFMVSNPTQAGVERVHGKIVDHFKEVFNIDLDIQFPLMGDYASQVNMMLASGEKVDVFNAGQCGFSASVANQSLYDMYENDLIQNYGADIVALIESIDPVWLRGTTVNGALLGVPLMRDMATGLWCIVFARSFLEGIDFDFSTIDPEASNPYTSEQMTTLMADLHEAYPDINVIFPWGYGYLSQKLMYDPIGGDVFGVLLDPANSLEVSNLFTSDMFREFCELLYGWNQAGYISPDAITETQGGGPLIMAGTLMSDTTGGKPGIVRQKEVERADMDSIAFQLGPDFAQSGLAQGAAWAINSNTEVPEAAMTVLNEFYHESIVGNLMMWGEEGVDYVISDTGHATFPEGVTLETSEYYNFLPSWALPTEYIVHVGAGYPIDRWEQEKEFNKNALKSKAIGFSFDNSAVSAEYTALQNVWVEYGNSLCFGTVDPATGIPELQSRLEAAGLEAYIAAKTEALNAWAEANNVQ